jgi:RNA polymerase sigma factor (sigma-70 family)
MTSLLTSTSAPALRQALLANREQVLTRLYRQAFPTVRRHVSQHGGSAQDAQDIFQDALVILYEQAVSEKLLLTATAVTYVVSIARNLWRHEQYRRARHPHDALAEDQNQAPAEPTATAEDAGFAVLDYVERLGEKCKSILLGFYYFQQPLTQLAAVHQFRSVRSATVQKFKCLERLRQSVRTVIRPESVEY